MMSDLVLAFDLGTGGCKGSLWSEGLECVAQSVVSYPTHHPGPGRNEQRPLDWWDALITATRALLRETPDASSRIAGIALSGQSLGMIQLDRHGELVHSTTPIWSDMRGAAHVDTILGDQEEDWYLTTGNGFGAAFYPLFKAVAERRERPEAWARTTRLIGSKDWINLRLTGQLRTDHTYASGSGAYSLAVGGYDDGLLAAADVDRSYFPEPCESHEIVGNLHRDVSAELGLRPGIPVFAGAVDNACMALGSRGVTPGSVYAALGSSSWMTVTAQNPILDGGARPYVFRHAIPGLHISALSTFSSGTSLGWLRDQIAPGTPTADFIDEGVAYEPGASGTLFLPMLAGGTPLEGGPAVRGALVGLDLSHGRAAMARAGLEGIAFALRRSLDLVRELSGTNSELLISGGGAQHDGWNQIYADILGTRLVRTAVDQQAATLGAATIALVGLGAASYTDALHPHRTVATYQPSSGTEEIYEETRARFDAAAEALVPVFKKEHHDG